MSAHEEDMTQLVDRLRERLENWAAESTRQAGEIGDLKRWLAEAEAERDALKAAIERARQGLAGGISRMGVIVALDAALAAPESYEGDRPQEARNPADSPSGELPGSLPPATADGASDSTPEGNRWSCPRCGSDQWVAASLTGPVEYGGRAIKQCIPCGHYSNDPVKPEPTPDGGQ